MNWVSNKYINYIFIYKLYIFIHKLYTIYNFDYLDLFRHVVIVLGLLFFYFFLAPRLFPFALFHV